MNPSRKLRSRRGASILIALLLFLLCAFVGSAVLTAAYQSVSRTPAAQQEQQAYLGASSAALLLRDALVGQSVQLQQISQQVYTLFDDGTTQEEDASTWRQLARGYTGLLAPVSQEALKVFQGTATGAPYKLSFSLDGYPQLSGVQGELSMSGGADDSYTLTALVWDENGGNHLELAFSYSTADDLPRTTETSIQREDGTALVTSTTVHTTTVTWTGAAVRPAGSPVGEEGPP